MGFQAEQVLNIPGYNASGTYTLLNATNNFSNMLGQRARDDGAKKRQAILDASQNEAAKRQAITFQDKQDELLRAKTQRNNINAVMASPDIFGTKETNAIEGAYTAPGANTDKLNAQVLGNYNKRVADPLMTSKQRANTIYGGLLNNNVDPIAAAKVAKGYETFAKPAKVDNTEVLKALSNVYKESGKTDRGTARVPGKKGMYGMGYNPKDDKTAAGAFEWIDKNADKYTMFSQISGEDSGYSLKTKVAKMLETYPPGAVNAALKEFRNGSNGLLDTRTVNVTGMEAHLAKQAKDGVYDKGKWNGGPVQDREVLLANQKKRDTNYKSAVAALLHQPEVDKRVGMSAYELAFGVKDPNVNTTTPAVPDASKEVKQKKQTAADIKKAKELQKQIAEKVKLGELSYSDANKVLSDLAPGGVKYSANNVVAPTEVTPSGYGGSKLRSNIADFFKGLATTDAYDNAGGKAAYKEAIVKAKMLYPRASDTVLDGYAQQLLKTGSIVVP